ncbi:MAG: hypothetical protein A2915_01330 [Candidatus Yanofskybacteria bacterium RIFCSPLOWO2_01_FULL_41_34]|uniref:Baseplate protein J-like domain-containing protein n=1 Tax=Candidatus Yanofskybacteria bacterium RIFCSPHIGHO2_01_FULL_41_26 TaxID=1802661 RepID=A0A1F8ECM2_9BACT|nr:MAG: hypothetical protein A2649_01805 [Candidatus Yanofskybacteria bacterium RIFCSPHIGHO2_01_FULL_41_26]OGN21875.1 MAG: hypothetical protein A2915_01330 [Candidatus Yanofskybacteria bacterium RIFCSPLOWO2_01_FULL_41_34]
MASTKIINVLKDDKFEEILDLFKDSLAKEVIFVLPKTSRAFKNEEHFIILEHEAEKSDKKISLLCSSPDINKLAKKYKFDVLLTKAVDDDENKEEKIEEETIAEPAMYRENNDDNEEYQFVTVSKTKRGLDDIVKQEGQSLKVTLRKEQPTNLDIKKKPTYQSVDDIKNIWREQSERVLVVKDSMWTDINNRTKKSFKNFPRRLIIILGGVSIIVLGAIIYMTTGSANISITPHKQPLDFQLKVSASDRFSAVDASLNKIPGQMFNTEKNASQTFFATGEKDVAQKARGTITVFNEYGTTPQVLIATTRFQTSDGLVFRTLKGIVIPGTTVVGGKIIPGSINVEVIADKAGQEYNVPANKFGIPAFREKGDTIRYEKIYGKSDTAIKGGIIGKAKVVTEIDFNTAKQTLTDQVAKDVQDSLKTQTAGLKIINASAVKLKALESTAKTDEATDSFTMTVNGSIKTVGFKEDDLNNLIKQYVDKKQNFTIVPEKITKNYADITFDEINNTLTFTANIKGDGYAKVDSDKIKTDLAGQSEMEIKNYFKGAVGIDSAKVILSPFWVKRIPRNGEKTSIQINY